MSIQFVCHINDIPEQGSKGFSLTDTDDESQQDFFIVNRGNEYFAYQNTCPHTGANLNWQPDVYLDFDNFYIQCAIHAARFEVETGLCVWGPCVNRSLIKVPIKIENQKIYLSLKS